MAGSPVKIWKKPPNLEQIDTKGFSMDFGSIEPPQQHTKNLGKYSFTKGIIFKMASKMAVGSLKRHI